MYPKLLGGCIFYGRISQNIFLTEEFLEKHVGCCIIEKTQIFNENENDAMVSQ